MSASSRLNRSVTSVFSDSRGRPTNQPAVKYSAGAGQWKQISWSEYVAASEKLAGALAASGVQRGDRVAIMSNTRFEWAAADMAILCMGAVTVPIYQSSPIDDVEFILTNSEATAVFVEDQGQYEKFLKVAKRTEVKAVISFSSCKSQGDSPCLSMEKALEKGTDFLRKNPKWFDETARSVKPEDLATIVYTSGTTGVPKGVMLLHSCIISECEDLLITLDIGPTDSTLTFLPYAHIFGRVEHWMHIYTGWVMWYAESIDRIAANLIDAKPTLLMAVPRIFEKVYNRVLSQAQEGSGIKCKIFNWAASVGSEVSKFKQRHQEVPLPLLLQYQVAYKLVFSKLAAKMGGNIRFFVSGGAPLAKEIAEFFHAASIMVCEGYGLTETTAAVFVNTPYKYKFGTVGLAVGDTQVKIAGDGEILVKGGKIMKGYFKNDSATAEVMTDGWFHTGDIGELDSEGFLRITDRKKDLIKTAAGKMVAPQKIENVLKTNKLVSQVVVYGDKMKYLVALITLNPDEVKKFAETHGIKDGNYASIVKNPKIQQAVKEVIQEKNSALGSWETIKNFAILPGELTVEAGELTPSLKVKRKFCSEKYGDVIKGLYAEA